MTYQRLPYDEASTPTEMASDCQAVGIALQLPRRVFHLAVSPQAPVRVQQVPMQVTDAAARFAGRFLD